MNDFYEVLGCDKSDSYEVIKSAYYKLILLHHPDKSDEPSTRFQEIQEAWNTLKEPSLRLDYDRYLSNQKFESERFVYASVSTAEMTYSSEDSCYIYYCRCGGQFILPSSTLEFGGNLTYVECDNCSFSLCVSDSTER